MDPFVRFADAFRPAGAVVLDACPLCGGGEFAEIWRLPQNRLSHKAYLDAPGSPLDRLYLDYLPTLRTPQDIFRFDICDRCESIFLNPKYDDQANYVIDVSKVESYRAQGLDDFRGAADTFIKMFPPGCKVVLDAACGAGQALSVIKQGHPSLRLIGLEISKPSVEFMKSELGMEAYLTDLDHDDLDALVAPESVDFIILQEAFEHVSQPLTVMKKLTRLLRPGGRMHFTAQYYGDTDLQIRVGEPIYINTVGFNFVIDELGVDLLDLRLDVKIRALIEKPGGPTPRAGLAQFQGALAADSFPTAHFTPPRTHRPWYRRVWSSFKRRTGLFRRRK